MPEVGSKAPQFTLQSQDGETVSLKDYLGKKVVLYFYPKDDTPGCTKEACSFTDNFAKFKKLGAVVLGVSADTVDSHKKFEKKYNLGITLLSDPKKEVINKYGVWKEKNMYGKKSMGIERTTFLIDEEGKIARAFPRVKVDGHTDKVLEELNKI
jgi:thioredoxin-dependent peroxiredoxin